MVRHGLSMWNKLNIFTGWVDVPLCKEGVEEAVNAGKILKDMRFDVVFTSELVRAIETTMFILRENQVSLPPIVLHKDDNLAKWSRIYGEEGKKFLPVIKSWKLNERYYGELQGENKDKAKREHGDETVHMWRRGFDARPPNGESLKDTLDRVIEFYDSDILKEIKSGKNVMISAHGNSLRALVYYLDGLKPEDALTLEIPTGKPLFYEFKDGRVNKIGYNLP